MTEDEMAGWRHQLDGREFEHRVTKSWTLLSNFTFTFHFHALEKEMATHSGVLVQVQDTISLSYHENMKIVSQNCTQSSFFLI